MNQVLNSMVRGLAPAGLILCSRFLKSCGESDRRDDYVRGTGCLAGKDENGNYLWGYQLNTLPFPK